MAGHRTFSELRAGLAEKVGEDRLAEREQQALEHYDAESRAVTADDALQRDALEALVRAWPEPFDITRLEYGTEAKRLAALDVLRADGLAEPGEGPTGRATQAARRAVRLLDW